MKRIILIGLLVCGVALMGCKPYTVPLPSGVKVVTSENTEEVKGKVAEGQEPMSWDAEDFEQGDTTYGIHPGIVLLEKMKPARVVDTWQDDDVYGFYEKGDPTGVVISNNTNEEQTFVLSVLLWTEGRCEFYGTEGYIAPPEYVRDWIVIQDTHPILKPKEAKLIPIALVIPKDAEVFAPMWEFKIRVWMEQIGSAQYDQYQRWLVHMGE